MSEQSKNSRVRMKVLCLCFSPIRATYIYTHIYIYIFFLLLLLLFLLFFCFFALNWLFTKMFRVVYFFEKPNFLKLLHEAWDLYLAGLKKIL